MTAQQLFKTAFATARTMRARAAGKAEYSVEHGRHFVSEKFCYEVRTAAGFNPSTSAPEFFHAANAAALIVAVQAINSKSLSLSDRLLQRKAADEFVSDFN